MTFREYIPSFTLSFTSTTKAAVPGYVYYVYVLVRIVKSFEKYAISKHMIFMIKCIMWKR
jgi:hypothetical protein